MNVFIRNTEYYQQNYYQQVKLIWSGEYLDDKLYWFCHTGYTSSTFDADSEWKLTWIKTVVGQLSSKHVLLQIKTTCERGIVCIITPRWMHTFFIPLIFFSMIDIITVETNLKQES